MAELPDFTSMTVLDLRKFAKEQGVALTGLTTKAAIIERLTTTFESREQAQDRKPVAQPRRTQSLAPVRRATIIADDGDEITPPKPPQPRPGQDKNRTSTGKIKPAFTLQGSRAWHNPQPFTQTQPQSRRYAPQITQGINTLPRDAGALDTSLYTPVKPRPAPMRPASRFGPDAAVPEPGVDARPVYPESRQQTAVDTSRESGGQHQSTAFRSSLLHRTQVPYPDTVPAMDSAIPEPGFPEPLQARAPAQVADLLAAGDLGDGAGILEIQQDGFGFLRAGNLLPGRNDIYISSTQIRRFKLRDGDYVVGKTRSQRENDRYAAMLFITAVNGEDIDTTAKFDSSADETRLRRNFDELTPVYPNRRIRLSSREENDLVLRLIDLFVPIGFGQRAMIVAAPKAGKTTILKKIALSLKRNHPDVHTMMLLVDERPEEVTDLRETVGGDIFYSTFDEPPENHVKVAEMVLERAKRLVEHQQDVVILLDSLTRLARAHNLVIPSSGRTLSGGIDPASLHKPKRFFGAARKVEEGGSLTILATALIETGSRMDEVIFEEFKGTGNMELVLDRRLAERRMFPAIDLKRSGTRKEELLLSDEELELMWHLRRIFGNYQTMEVMEMMSDALKKTRSNQDLLRAAPMILAQ